MGEGGVKNYQELRDVICGRPLRKQREQYIACRENIRQANSQESKTKQDLRGTVLLSFMSLIKQVNCVTMKTVQ